MAFNTPLILLAGQAGSGKDTVGGFLARTYNATTISLADPIKRFAFAVFEFAEDQLWGPSGMRDLADLRFDSPQVVSRVNVNYSAISNDWVEEVLPDIDGDEWNDATLLLDEWFNQTLSRVFLGQGLSPRVVLQTLGTEWGRSIKENIWVDYATKAARRLLTGGYEYQHTTGLMTSTDKAPDYTVITDGRFRNEILAIREANGVALRIVRPVERFVGNHQSVAELAGIPDHFFTEVLANTTTLEDLFAKVADHMLFAYGDARGAITK